MSQETKGWLNQFVLVGNTDKLKDEIDAIDPCESRYDSDGHAWHYDAALQGAEPNHYTGFIPVEDVIRRLFSWEPMEIPAAVHGAFVTPDGVEDWVITDNKKKHIVRPPRSLGPDDEGAIFSLPSSDWKAHPYKEWLLTKVAHLLGDELGIGSAGLLRQGAVAFVMVEVPETITTPEGVEFKPRLGAVTSFDGSYSSTYKRQIANWVCDNTMRAGLSLETGQELKIRHTKNSADVATIANMAQATGIVHTSGDAFMAEVATLCDIKVSDGDWEQFLETLAPSKNQDGTTKTGSGATRAENKRVVYDTLWRTDPRVAPWTGSAWGVVQAVNTYEHHLNGVRGKKDDDRPEEDIRAERNMRSALSGDFDNLDANTFKSLQKVLA